MKSLLLALVLGMLPSTVNADAKSAALPQDPSAPTETKTPKDPSAPAAEQSAPEPEIKLPDCSSTQKRNPVSASAYAPADLRWGMCPSEARELLSKKATFENERLQDAEDSYLQYYKGEFAGFNATFEVMFCEKKSLCAVGIAPSDPAPISKDWEMLLEKTKSKFGKPKRLSGPPDVSNRKLMKSVKKNYPVTKNRERVLELIESTQDSLEQNRYTILDSKIASGEWKPQAVWHLKDKVAIVVSVGDSESLLTEGAFLLFASPEAQKSVKDTQKKKSLDF